jgi:hypothetical protein
MRSAVGDGERAGASLRDVAAAHAATDVGEGDVAAGASGRKGARHGRHAAEPHAAHQAHAAAQADNVH